MRRILIGLGLTAALTGAHCFPVAPKTGHCEACFEGKCFNNGSCNRGCKCFKVSGEQTGVCTSFSYHQMYLEHGYQESK